MIYSLCVGNELKLRFVNRFHSKIFIVIINIRQNISAKVAETHCIMVSTSLGDVQVIEE